jgi:hypothetical protein
MEFRSRLEDVMAAEELLFDPTTKQTLYSSIFFINL